MMHPREGDITSEVEEVIIPIWLLIPLVEVEFHD